MIKNTVTWAVEYNVPKIEEWRRTSYEYHSFDEARNVEASFHSQGIKARIIERTTTERYLSKYDL